MLSGTAGALINVLDAVLINGFGLQTASSLVVTDGVAVVNVASAPSAIVDSVVLIAGATPAGLNGEKRVTSVTSNSVSFATTEANGTATGTITMKVAPAGWSKAFSGTNLGVYKIINPMGTGFFLRVGDAGTTVSMVRGHETMSDVNTGTGLFPVSAQLVSGGFWSKSNAVSTAARPWRIVADDRGFFYFVKNADTASEYQGNYFGDILPIKSNDPYACVLRANTVDRSAIVVTITDDISYADSNSSIGGLYAARAANTLGGSAAHYQAPVMSVGLALTHATGAVGQTYPSPVDNGLLLTPVCIYSAQGYRGYYPGLRFSPQITNVHFSTGDTVAGSGDMAGKKVTVIKMGAPTAGATQGVVFVDHTSDWR